jgi:hypothetical protein
MSTPRPKTWIYVLAGAIPAVALVSLSIYAISKAVRDMGVSDGGTKVTELCISRLSKVASAQLLYAADHDEMLPPAEIWVDATWKYAAAKDPGQVTESVFKCPVIALDRGGGYGYGFNAENGSLPLARIQDPATKVAVFDSKELSRNASGVPAEMFPERGRHSNGMEIVIAYLDGRARPVPKRG